MRRELLPVVKFTRQYRSYLLDRRFVLRTDHGSLSWLQSFREPEGQLAHWLEQLQEFDFKVIHRRGIKHINADALSRLPKARAPLQGIKTGYPQQIVPMDILGPFPESQEGNKYILVMSDSLTRWVEAYALQNKLVDEFFFRFGPEQLHSDQGRNFEAEVVQEICKLLEIVKTRTSSYHPQSDGLVERMNHTLLDMQCLWQYVSNNPAGTVTSDGCVWPITRVSSRLLAVAHSS